MPPIYANGFAYAYADAVPLVPVVDEVPVAELPDAPPSANEDV